MFSLKECFSYKYKERSEKNKEYGEKLYSIEMLFAIWSQKTFSEWFVFIAYRIEINDTVRDLSFLPFFYNDLIYWTLFISLREE